MYLKSIEVHGFKSFANKIVFEFHNGITGIVGPNGSGKSNVADAVRWVLGEQRAKQLRGESMQDVIFAGTENRKPLSYAYVAITLDNSDHQLAVDFEEVTVSRRVYRSGESEYLINGTACRLKDVNELFYDTGIGKEGYSIIGQGQIEKILNGKPDERRELFDEAAGIVKFKRRKATAQKKLENERENLVRVNDILVEQERQLAPLERQSEKARVYLKKKEELKVYDVNMFLLETKRLEEELTSVKGKYDNTSQELERAKKEYENIRKTYEKLEADITSVDQKTDQIKDEISNASILKGKLEGQINVLKEQIHTAELTEEHVESQRQSIHTQIADKENQLQAYVDQKQELETQVDEVVGRKTNAQKELSQVQEEIRACQETLDQGKSEMIDLLNRNVAIKAGQQRYRTMMEQINIRKAQLTQRLIQRKSDEEDLEKVIEEYTEQLKNAEEKIKDLESKKRELEEKRFEWKQKYDHTLQEVERSKTDYHRQQSRLESLKNIAERYDGYGNSIRKVMEQKESHPGLIGVVSELLQVDKKYEVAIETALGGGIRNIVTEDEATAKEMIGYLKQNRFGRATFLPLTSVGRNSHFKNQDVLKEAGVIGRANELVKTEERFSGIMEYLLGRTIVIDHLDRAVQIAKKYHYSIPIVTLEGDQLSPGGSMTGGAFKNNSNLLGRKREIEELESGIVTLQESLTNGRNRLGEIDTARVLLKDDIEQLTEDLQQAYLIQNTARMNAQRSNEQKTKSDSVYATLQVENNEIEEQLKDVNLNMEKIVQDIDTAKLREQEIEQENRKGQQDLEAHKLVEAQKNQVLSAIQLEEANIRQREEFLVENVNRIQREIANLKFGIESLKSNAAQSKQDVADKRQAIEKITKTIEDSEKEFEILQQRLEECGQQKEDMNQEHKAFFQKREDISNHMNNLDKEVFRLGSQREKLESAQETQTNYMWEEYELTLHAAMDLKNPEYVDLADMKKQIAEIKDEIRKLGDVNVNAIEDYKNLAERYEFLKTQHDDLVTAEKTLLEIIEELDAGMRKQFTEKFAQIQQEFDKAFKELFGGGKGTLELVEDEDILECGIRIIAQPPGKKLQNMMQLSGGEKSLTAIALLFAIQNLKPSPFCLLDEIEAALDDSNVGRFAKYLNKLTKNTQFIIITHRRGTMSAADRLYGITMQEKGVSTLVSVNLIENDLDK